MLTAGPGEVITIAQSGIPTGQDVGYQVIKAVSGSVAIGRTSTGVVERPAGSGNYVMTFVAPVEVDIYLIVLDWNAGVINSTKSKVEELQVTSAVMQEETGLGLVADYAKANLGGETFQILLDSANYGSGFIALAIAAVEARVSNVAINESLLPVVVLSYLGKLVALELMSAAIDVWNNRPQAKSIASDPVETVTYPNRSTMLGDLANRLLAGARAEQALALRLLPDSRLLDASTGPAIDEGDCGHVTRDPRLFPREHEYPYRTGVYAGQSATRLYGP